MDFESSHPNQDRSDISNKTLIPNPVKQIDTLLIRQIQGDFRLPVMVNSVIAIALAIVFRNVVPLPQLALWLTTLISWNILRLLFLGRSPSFDASISELYGWARLATIVTGVNGAIWGAAAVLLFPIEALQYQVILAFVVGGLSAGAVATYAAWPPAFYAFVTFSMGPLIFRFALEQTELSFFMAAVLLLFVASMAALTKSYHRTIRNVILLEVDRNEMEQEKNVSEKLFSKAFHSSPAPFAISRPDDGSYIDVNQAWSNLTGYSHAEAIINTSLELGLWTHPEDRTRFMEMLDHGGVVLGFETDFRTKSGEHRDVLVSAECVEIRGERRLLFVGQDITRLKEIERLKSEFVSIVSHELRTPLTSIHGALRLLQGGAAGSIDGSVRELVELAARNSQYLGTLVDDILDFEKLQAGKIVFQFAEFDMVNMVKDAIDQSLPYGIDHKVEFILLNAPKELLIQGDERRLKQVVLNILSNAAKFSPKGERVEVYISQKDEAVHVAFADHGPGIKEYDHPKIFDRFTQADSTDVRNVGGVGLGLSICKSIIDKHNGRIDFEPTEGGGTTFYFDVPIIH